MTLLLLFSGARLYNIEAAGPITSGTFKGGKWVVPPLTRKRWKELLALEAAAEEAKKKALALKKEKDRLAAVAAAEAARAVVLAERARQHAAFENEQHLIALRHALDAFNGAKRASSTAAKALEAAALAARAWQEFENDEEAIALLLIT